MRVLLDECLPRRLKRDLAGHAVRTVPEAGWAGRDNGDLLSLAETQFDVFVTIDQHLASQQRVPKFRIAVVVLSAPSNRYEDRRPLVPKLLDAIAVAKRGEVTRVGPCLPAACGRVDIP